MKKNLPYYLFIILLFCGYHTVFSQKITVDSSIPLQQLIEDNLVEGGCVEITNITTSINGSAFGFSSYGQFNRASSNFPFENGIILSTGNATSGGNGTTTPVLSEGSTTWGGDSDLESTLGISNTINATSIEFDFVSISNQVQFNYILASEEYFDINPCQVSDGFAFLIKETGSTAPYQNIALVPNTSIPVSTTTIHNEIFGVCPAQNEQYFDGYNIGDTNFNGRTTALTAAATIVPYVQYHIKLIIADQGDREFDSAVFIEGNSFDILNLGDDISTCNGSALLDANINNNLATYRWFLDNTQIPGATNATHTAIQSGTYRVEVTVPLSGGTNCIEEDEIVVLLNTEEPTTPISDYQLCDDLSGNNTETFNLTTKENQVINAIPSGITNYNISYHESDAEARTNSNAILNAAAYTSGSRTIFVRIEDIDTGCFAYPRFNIVVNTIPNITDPSPLEICDTDDTPDGRTSIDLTQKDDEISGGQANFFISYHYNTTDQSNGNNPIPTPYFNTNTPTDTIYVRVINTQTGCVNFTTLTVNVTTSPIINRDTQFIDACDQDHDGQATFNLEEVIADVLAGLPAAGVTITFHESLVDAELGDNPIANPTNYQNIILEEQTVYIRVEDNTTGCGSVTPVEIHTNLLLTATTIQDFALCDNNEDPNDTLNFDLTTVTEYIANELPNIMVTYYETEDDLNNNVNPIDTSAFYSTTSPKQLFIKIENGDCSENGEITLIINPILLFNPTAPLSYCDTDDDGVVSIDLHSLDNIINSGNPNFEVHYFLSYTDADNNINELPPFHSSGSTTLFARIENVGTGCRTINEFDINIIQAPAITQPNPIIICDDDQDGFSMVDFVARGTISEIVADPTGLIIDFFTSLPTDKDTMVDVIPDISAFNAQTQTVYIRVKSGDPQGCYNLAVLDVIVNTLPVFPTITNFELCEDDNDNQTDFLFSDYDVEVLNGQTGKEVFYFENENDALTRNIANAIDKNNLYTNTSSPQSIYIRVENITDTNCFDTAEFTIEVSSNPLYNPVVDFTICDDSTNDGFHNFDLDEKIAEISNGFPNIQVSFHKTRPDAENDILPLGSNYTNVTNPETIFARIKSINSKCAIVEAVGIIIIEAPDLTPADPMISCDADYDGFTAFNLENANFQILDRLNGNPTTNYFENLADVDDNTLEIPNPTAYISDSKTVYIKVTNNLTGCYTVIPLELIVNLPPARNTNVVIPICYDPTNTYNLSQADNLIVNDPSIVNISYHNSENDAQNNTAAIGTIFNYTTTGNNIIWTRLEDPANGCVITNPFTLQVNPNPIANTPPTLTSCDDDYDGFYAFDLSNTSSTSNAIRGGLSTSAYTVTYYSDLANAESATNKYGNLYPAIDGELIFARIENNSTGCFDTTQFNTSVFLKPIIDIDDIVPLCINNLPLIISAETNNIGDTYLWSTGETSSVIQLNNLTDVGDYSITITTPNNCSTTKDFKVIESVEATINFTTTVDFADPNSITIDVSGIGNYLFSLDGGEPQTSNIFPDVYIGPHIVTVKDLNGCEDVEREVVVIDVPKFVTPNGDGAFDTWHITGVNQLTGTVVHIYNRMGKLLKTLPHTSPGWDGTFNGANMPSDDYWYVGNVFYNGTEFQIKGHFALKR